MLKFDGHRSLDELRRLCKRRGWKLDTARYDSGSDWVSFTWPHDGVERLVLYSPFNGRFLVEDGSEIYSERSADGCTPWYDDLLRTLYKGSK
jgi:hypothetical protein